jgi:hypothetical protein
MKISNFFNNIWSKAGDALIASNHEPQIERKCDRHGNKYWQAYDLYSNKSYTFGSEQEVRVWLENRYHCFN